MFWANRRIGKKNVGVTHVTERPFSSGPEYTPGPVDGSTSSPAPALRRLAFGPSSGSPVEERPDLPGWRRRAGGGEAE